MNPSLSREYLNLCLIIYVRYPTCESQTFNKKPITQLSRSDPLNISSTSTTSICHITSLWPLTYKPVHVTVSAWSTLAALLSPPHHTSVCPPLSTGWRPDFGGEWPQLSEHPARRSRQGPEVVTAPDDDGERRGPPAARQDSGGWDQVDRQLADRRELRQQQHGRVSFPTPTEYCYSDLTSTSTTFYVKSKYINSSQLLRYQQQSMIKLWEMTASSEKCCFIQMSFLSVSNYHQQADSLLINPQTKTLKCKNGFTRQMNAQNE